MRNHIITTLLAFVCSISAIVAQSTNETFAERQRRQLTLRGEQIEQQLQSARTDYLVAPSDSLAKVIHQLEKQSLAIGATLEKLTAIIEQEQAIAQAERRNEESSNSIETPSNADDKQPATPTQPTEQVAEQEEIAKVQQPSIVADAATIEQTTTQPMEPQISEELRQLFLTSMRRYKVIEDEIALLIDSYTIQYDSAQMSRREYDKATSLQALNNHYNTYLSSLEKCGNIADKIVERSDMLFASKTKSLLGFADTLSLSSLEAEHAASMEDMEHKMAEKLQGKCTDTDLAIYPHKLKCTIELEREIASHIAPEEVANIEKHLASIDPTSTLYPPIDAPKRSNAQFSAVKVNSRAKHKAVSALPTLKIPSSGELYSITVANYASLPPSTSVFRNATPLYRERREDGRTYIYIGLYPTANSAQDDIAYLKKIGFKQPTLVMWRDGIRRDDFVDRNTTTAKPRAAMFRVEISTSTTGTLSAEVLDIIKTKAPRKELSKFVAEGSTTYTIGIFTKENEAQTLAKAILQADTSISAKVVQIGK